MSTKLFTAYTGKKYLLYDLLKGGHELIKLCEDQETFTPHPFPCSTKTLY